MNNEESKLVVRALGPFCRVALMDVIYGMENYSENVKNVLHKTGYEIKDRVWEDIE